MFGRLLFGFCTLSISVVMLTMLIFLRNLPLILRLLLSLLRQVFYLSYLICEALLTQVQRYFFTITSIDVLHNPYRTLACCLLSLGCYALLIRMLNHPFSHWIAICVFAHGLLIGILWKDFFEPQGLNMGEPLW